VLYAGEASSHGPPLIIGPTPLGYSLGAMTLKLVEAWGTRASPLHFPSFKSYSSSFNLLGSHVLYMSSNVFSKWEKNDEFIMKISTYILILGVFSYY
jgi:hypothetical protein